VGSLTAEVFPCPPTDANPRTDDLNAGRDAAMRRDVLRRADMMVEWSSCFV
jgi:hypothetical protein